MYRRSIAAIVLLSAMLLAGCAKNQLIRLEAADFAKSAGTAEARARGYYDAIVDEDREFWAVLNSIDPKCTPDSLAPSSLTADTNRDGKVDDADVGFCAPGAPTSALEVLATDVGRKTFLKQYASLRFVRSYVGALATAAAEPELEAEALFSEAFADLKLLSDLLKLDPLLSDEQASSIGELLSLVEELAKEARSAAEIRTIVLERGPDADRAFDAIIDGLIQDSSLRNAMESIAAQLAVIADRPDARRKALALHYQRQDRGLQAEECKLRVPEVEKRLCGHPEAALIYAASVAHEGIVQLLQDNPSEKQRQRRIKLERARFTRIAKAFIDIRGLF